MGKSLFQGWRSKAPKIQTSPSFLLAGSVVSLSPLRNSIARRPWMRSMDGCDHELMIVVRESISGVSADEDEWLNRCLGCARSNHSSAKVLICAMRGAVRIESREEGMGFEVDREVSGWRRMSDSSGMPAKSQG